MYFWCSPIPQRHRQALILRRHEIQWIHQAVHVLEIVLSEYTRFGLNRVKSPATRRLSGTAGQPSMLVIIFLKHQIEGLLHTEASLLFPGENLP